jgi:fibronectin type 3 domain-containing protein
VTPLSANAPLAPTSVAAQADSEASIVRWTAPADGGSAITGYQIWKGTSSGGEALVTTVPVQNSYVDSAVVSGTTYWYQVAAVNVIGPGPKSNERSAKLATVPSAPTLLGAAADGAAALSWTAPSSDGGSTVSAYRIYRKVGSGTESLLTSTSGTTTTYVDGALTNGTAYTYRVAAVNGAGEGPKSNAVTVTPTAPDVITAPDPPRSLVASRPRTGTAVILRWTAPTADGGSPIASYFVYRRAPGETGFTLIGVAGPATLTYTDGAVGRRVQYTYYVTAFNSHYESAPSNQVSIRTK